MPITIGSGVSIAGGMVFTAGAPPGPSAIGEAFGGGYYAGQISTTGNGVATHYLVVSPKAEGQATYQWKTSNTASAGVNSAIDGFANTDARNNADHPLMQWARGLTIGGYTDWYIPAPYEWKVIYYFLKGTANNNDTGSDWGYNPYSVAPYTQPWTTSVPAQTSLALFQQGGAQSIVTTNPNSIPFWSSWNRQPVGFFQSAAVFYSSTGTGYTDGGTTQGETFTTSLPARAIRKVPV